MLTQKSFKGSAVSLNYMEGPPGGPAILLLHGLTQRWQAFQSLLPELTQAYHVFAPDFRGHGLSSHVANGYRGEDYGHDILEFIDQVIREPLILFGHSLGGMVGVYVAACRPEMVRALIAGDSWFFRDSPSGATFVDMFQKTLAMLREDRDFNRLRRLLAEMMVRSPVYGELPMKSLPGCDEAYIAAWARSLSRLDPDTLAMTLDGRASANWRPAEFLGKVRCTTLLLQADPKMGGLMSDADVKRIRELLPETQHVCLTGLGHSLHMTESAPVERALRNFLSSLD